VFSYTQQLHSISVNHSSNATPNPKPNSPYISLLSVQSYFSGAARNGAVAARKNYKLWNRNFLLYYFQGNCSALRPQFVSGPPYIFRPSFQQRDHWKTECIKHDFRFFSIFHFLHGHFPFYQTDSMDSQIIQCFHSAQRLNLFTWCVRLNRL